MITEQGIVEKVTGRTAVVRIEKSAACAACQSRDACREVSPRDMNIELVNELGARIGDRIEISIPAGTFLMLSLLVYILPVIGLIVGAFAGGAFGRRFEISVPVSSVVGGILVMGITFFGLKRLDRSTGSRKGLQPHMTRVLYRSGVSSEGRKPDGTDSGKDAPGRF